MTVRTDTIVEYTALAGVTIDGVLLKDGSVDGVDVSAVSTAVNDAAQAIPHSGTLMLPQTMEYANGGVYNVEAYGALCDGSADDTLAVQAAITAAGAAGNGIVTGPPGTSICTKLTITAPIAIDWPGGTLKLKNATNDHLLYASGVDDIQLRNLTLDGNHAGQSGSCSALYLDNCDDVVTQNVRVINPYGNVASAIPFGVTFKDCDRSRVVACSVDGAKYDGWMFKDGTGCQVIGGHFDNCGYSGVGTVGTTDAVLYGVYASTNGIGNNASGITLNGVRNQAIGCVGIGATAHGINLGHATQDASYSAVIGGIYRDNSGNGVIVNGIYPPGGPTSQAYIRVSGVLAYGNVGDGIKLYGADYAIVEGNHCYGNTDGGGATAISGIRLSDSDNCLIANNRLDGNKTYAILIDADCTKTVLDNNTYTGSVSDLGAGTLIDGYLANTGSYSETSGAGEDTLATSTLKGGTCNRNSVIRVRACGTKTGTAGNKTVKLYFDGVSVVTIPAATGADSWALELDLVAGTSLTELRGNSKAISASTLTHAAQSLTSKNLANDIVIALTGECADAGDKIRCNMWSVEVPFVGNR